MEQSTVSELAAALGENKTLLLDDIEHRVRRGVKSLGSSCFSVIELKSEGNARFDPPSIDWAKRFVLFCQKKSFKGNTLDSPVAEKVSEEVSAAFVSFYQDKSEEISAIVADDVAKDEVFVDALVEALINSGVVKASGQVATAAFNQKIRAVIVVALQSAQAKAIGAQLVGMTSALITKITTTSMGMVILRQIAIYSKVIITKILASAAFKTMVVAAVKKFAAAAILGVILKVLWTLLGAKLAAALGGAVFPIITLGVLGWVVYEIAKLPEKLGNKLAVEVRNKIDGEVGKINEQIAADIYEQLGGNIGSIAAGLATDHQFVSALNECLAGEV